MRTGPSAFSDCTRLSSIINKGVPDSACVEESASVLHRNPNCGGPQHSYQSRQGQRTPSPISTTRRAPATEQPYGSSSTCRTMVNAWWVSSSTGVVRPNTQLDCTWSRLGNASLHFMSVSRGNISEFYACTSVAGALSCIVCWPVLLTRTAAAVAECT